MGKALGDTIHLSLLTDGPQKTKSRLASDDMRLYFL